MGIVEVNKRPTSGQWAEQVITTEGLILSDTYRINADGDEEYYSPENDRWMLVMHIRRTDYVDLKFFIAQPSFKETTFEHDWQILKWLKDNPDTKLHVNKECDACVFWIDTMNGYRLQYDNGETVHLTSTDFFRSNTTWYIKEGE